MSDQIYSIPVAIWSTAVFIQVDSAIRWWLKNRRIREEERRLNEFDWAKIQRGETKRGFRIWMESQCCPKSIDEEDSHYYLMKPQPPNDYDWDEWVKREPASVLMAITHLMPTGNIVTNLRRYSFFASDVYTDVAQVLYPSDAGWYADFFGIQLDDQTAALAFKNSSSGRICVVFVDVKQRSYRLLNVPPILIDFGSIEILCVRRGDGKRPNRLRLVYGHRGWNEYEVISIDYEIRPSEETPPRLFAVEMGRESIVIPGLFICTAVSNPGTYVLKAYGPIQSHYVVTIDQRGDVQLHHYDEWNRAIMTNDIEQRSRKAVDDFVAMLPEEWRFECRVYRYYNHIIGSIGDSFAKRPIYPPSMMHVAAEATCRSKPPNADLSMVKSETGIDIFDGIIEDQEQPVLTIYLPSNAELMQDEGIHANDFDFE